MMAKCLLVVQTPAEGSSRSADSVCYCAMQSQATCDNKPAIFLSPHSWYCVVLQHLGEPWPRKPCCQHAPGAWRTKLEGPLCQQWQWHAVLMPVDWHPWNSHAQAQDVTKNATAQTWHLPMKWTSSSFLSHSKACRACCLDRLLSGLTLPEAAYVAHPDCNRQSSLGSHHVCSG